MRRRLNNGAALWRGAGWPLTLMYAGLGLAMAAGQAPLSLAWLAFGALMLAMWHGSRVTNWRYAAWIGWVFGSGYFTGTLFWIVEPFFVDPWRHGWMAPFALFFMAGGLALFWGVAFGVSVRFGRTQAQRALNLAFSLAAAELTRSYILTGFPWALIGYIWTDTPLAQIAAWVGPQGLTLITLAAAVLPAGWSTRQGVFVGGALAACVLAVPAGVGMWRLGQPETPRADPVVVRLLQPNAPQHQKWDPQYIPQFLRVQMEMTSAPGAVDLIVWPETSVPYWLHQATDVFEAISQAAHGAPVIVGISRQDDDLKARNSMVVIGSAGQVTALYDKHHLVPFGEYLPFAWVLNRVGLFGLAEAAGGYRAGPGASVLDLGPVLGRILPLICYEMIFPQDLRAAPVRADWILQITNDAWFGKLAGPQQHLAQARMRAIEQGLPVLRSANTGVSAIIDAKGRVKGALALNTRGALDGAVPRALEPTVYVATGDAPAGLIILCGGAWAVTRSRFPASWRGRRKPKPVDGLSGSD
jgi:apolipoprotein N-acyltransferase